MISYATDFAANLHTIKTTTYPDNTTRIREYYQDGTLSKVTGSAVHPVKYVYEAKDGSPERYGTREIKPAQKRGRILTATEARSLPSRPRLAKSRHEMAIELQPASGTACIPRTDDVLELVKKCHLTPIPIFRY